MVAESWAVVCVPTMGIFGTEVATVVAALHLIVGYSVLGQIVARKRGDA
jgi:preprotein translocase subunit SecF